MRVFKLVFVFFICCVFIPLSGYSSDVLVPLVGSERAEELRNKGCVMDHNNKKDYPVLIPESQFVKEKIDLLIRELDPNLFVESLNLYEKPSDISSLWIRDQLNLFNSVLTLSTLKGLRYFSKTKGKMRILYEESFVVDSTDTSYRLPDPVFTALPDSLILYAKQKDSTFGENTYLYTYYCIPEGLIFIQENLTSMNYGFLSLIGKNRLRSVVAVFDAGNYLLIYTLSMAKASPVSWMEKRINESFINRTNALMEWFKGKADQVYSR